MHVGVDEAGRGPVLGPLVVAGVLGDPADVPSGVTDSKQLAPERRRTLADRIRSTGSLTCQVRAIEAPDLNERMASGETLDRIETKAFRAIIQSLDADRAVVDPVGSDPAAFEATLASDLDGCTVEARVAADAEDLLVGAASILAKVARDAAIEEIAESVGTPVGSGYPSDPTTRGFLTDWRKRSADPPPFARTAWSTMETLGFGSRRLDDYDAGGST